MEEFAEIHSSFMLCITTTTTMLQSEISMGGNLKSC